MQITQLLAGKTIEYLLKDGYSLTIRCHDGLQVRIAWVDPQTQQPLQGEPVITMVHGIQLAADAHRRLQPQIVGAG